MSLTWPDNAYVGQKITMTHGGDDWIWYDIHAGEVTPQFGEVYTIRAVLYDEYNQCVCFQLAEIINPPRTQDRPISEITFQGNAFRPVDERKTDISIFKKILIDCNAHAKVKEPVR